MIFTPKPWSDKILNLLDIIVYVTDKNYILLDTHYFPYTDGWVSRMFDKALSSATLLSMITFIYEIEMFSVYFFVFCCEKFCIFQKNP